MGQALYRKYRSRSFDEVVGQEHVTSTLKSAIKSGRISHAYLFTGPRGIGKTSVARILAHEVNNLPYKDESIHLDIIEIDAASNRRIDEIRDLRDRVHISPTSAKYKIYIIDEAHMLTREAFNALLKTLEEPPAHCIFILATTEAHKLPETIISRTQRFSFKPVPTKQAAKHLKMIAKKEGIKIDDGALELLAKHGDGSFRDSIGLLDQLGGTDKMMSEEMVRTFLGVPPITAIEDLITQIINGSPTGCIKILDSLREQGINPATVARNLSDQLRTSLAAGQSHAWTVDLLKNLLDVPASPQPQDSLEIFVLSAAAMNTDNNNPDSNDKKTGSDGDDPNEVNAVAKKVSKSPEDKPKISVTKSKFNLDDWPKIIEATKDKAASLYTALRLAEPRLDNGTLTLAFQFPLHQKKVVRAESIDIVGSVIEEVSGVKLTIKCIVDKTATPTMLAPEPVVPKNIPDDSEIPMTTISDIFGGAEVLES